MSNTEIKDLNELFAKAEKAAFGLLAKVGEVLDGDKSGDEGARIFETFFNLTVDKQDTSDEEPADETQSDQDETPEDENPSEQDEDKSEKSDSWIVTIYNSDNMTHGAATEAIVEALGVNIGDAVNMMLRIDREGTLSMLVGSYHMAWRVAEELCEQNLTVGLTRG